MWNKAYGGDSPASHWDKCVTQHLTETKCEQICTRKREIISAHFNPHVSPTLPKKSWRLCIVARRRRRLMRTEREVEEEKKKSKKISGEEIYSSGEMFPLLLEQKQQQQQQQVFETEGLTAQEGWQVEGRRDASKWLYDSCYQL